MIRFIACFSLLLAGVMCGCVSYRTPPADRRVTVSPDLRAEVWVTDIRLSRGQSQHYTLQANIVNNTNGDARFEYRVVWLDAAGVAIPSIVSDWQFVSAAAREIVGLTTTAPAPEAVDFRLYVQRSRR